MLLVIIPAYKPDDTLIKLIGDLEPYDLEKIVVDDGSGEEHEHIFNAVEDRCIVLRHEENRGKGAAIKTALGYIKDKTDGVEAIGVMDSDGQHLPEDMMKLLAAASLNKEALVLGVRAVGKDMPTRSRLGNKITRNVFRMVSGVAVSDTQTGLRAFSPELVERLKKSGRKVVIATGKPTKFTVDILERNGLGGLFDDVLGSEFDGTRSQKWEVIAELLKRYGSEDAVMVGDRDNDVNGAKKCGIPCIGVAWGYAEPGELLSAGAIYLAETVDELENILTR